MGAEVHVPLAGRNTFLKMGVSRQSGSAPTRLTLKLVTVNACLWLKATEGNRPFASPLFKKKRCKGLFRWKVHFGYPASLQALDPLKYLEHNRIENPYWQEATSWLFTSVTKDLNSQRLRTNPTSHQRRTRTQELWIASLTR